MYDQAKAARHRIVLAASKGGEAGGLYLKLADLLMRQPDSPRRIVALRRLADSCETAMAVLANTRQSVRNGPRSTGYPEKPSS